ncbi:uncharacterized protein LOC133290808 [Gastrolobium bilobum]|uniref:uncharacterized protein LOC133290808 n=1 Tax=Gastrolobium bilobum TaxID=150636 RepID=UPI002AB0B49E|nr:uncharacterized protein LOC133290808 [Gastrolobium bilobum]
MFNAKPELPQKSVLQIKQDDKFFCRLLTKESSMSNSSFRVNIGVPFMWESQPGKPKYTFSEDTLPPLTPPPSYHFNTINACKKPQKKKSSRSNLLLALLPKMNLKKIIMSSSSTSSLSSSYSSLSSPSSDSSKLVCRRSKMFLSFGSSFDFRGVNEENGATSPTSTLCFGFPRTTGGN